MTTRLIRAEVLVGLGVLDDNSVDAIVTDPPYELGFMGRSWDASGIAYSVPMWREVWRVLKPGGALLAFGGTRTYHRMVVAIEDAGFEIRDQLQWLYGSGFPKSLNVSKAIDKMAGATREVGIEGPYSARRPRAETTAVHAWSDGVGDYGSSLLTSPATPEAEQWDGWGTALKPANEPIVLARKPLSERTVAANVLRWGTGALNIDATRIEGDVPSTVQGQSDQQGTIYGTDQRAQRAFTGHADGRWPANVILTHHPGCLPGACVGDCPVEMLDDQSGVLSAGNHPRVRNTSGYSGGLEQGLTGHDGHKTEAGGASRFLYVAKASRAERNRGLSSLEQRSVHRYGAGIGEGKDPDAPVVERNHHPTVKPVALMQYLIRLVTPPGGMVLDPFVGSGTTMIAVEREGCSGVGIDRDAEYIEIARLRILGDNPLLNRVEVQE